MLEDNKNDAANPHKVFRWPEESASGGEQTDSFSRIYNSVIEIRLENLYSEQLIL